MSSKLNLPVPPFRNPQLMAILRIHVANFLAARYGINTFTRDSIDLLAMYLYQCIGKLTLHMKSILMGQGRTIPNFLHLLASYQIRNQGIDSLLRHLISRARNQQLVDHSKKYEIKGLLKSDRIFPLDITEKDHPNIYNFPKEHIIPSNSPLTAHKSMDEVLEKPPLYSYVKLNHRVTRQIPPDQIARQSNLALNSMRFAFSKKVRITAENKQSQDRNPAHSQRYSSEMKFQMCKFL